MPIPAGPGPLVSGVDYIDVAFDVYPFDGTTNVTLEIRPPSPAAPFQVEPGVPSEVTEDVGGQPATVQRWDFPPVPVGAPYGWWVGKWTVTGTGADVSEFTFYVEPPLPTGGPTWAPTLSRVAAYVPSRPLVPTPDGRNIDLGTWTSDTRPTDVQAGVLIMDAVNWVTDATGSLDVSLGQSANACAAIRAAAFIELGYPERDSTGKGVANTTSDRLFRQSEQMLKALVDRNRAITGTDGDDPEAVFEIAPAYNLPAPSRWGDWL